MTAEPTPVGRPRRSSRGAQRGRGQERRRARPRRRPRASGPQGGRRRHRPDAAQANHEEGGGRARGRRCSRAVAGGGRADRQSAPPVADALDEIRTALTAELAPTALDGRRLRGRGRAGSPDEDADWTAPSTKTRPLPSRWPSAASPDAATDPAPDEAACRSTPRRAGSPPTADAHRRRRTPTTPPARGRRRRHQRRGGRRQRRRGRGVRRRRGVQRRRERRDRIPRRRRRRRGGRRRRRGGSADGSPIPVGTRPTGMSRATGTRTSPSRRARRASEQHVSDEDGSAGRGRVRRRPDAPTGASARTDRPVGPTRPMTTPTTPPRTVSAAVAGVAVGAARTAPRRPTTRPRSSSGSASRAPAEGQPRRSPGSRARPGWRPSASAAGRAERRAVAGRRSCQRGRVPGPPRVGGPQDDHPAARRSLPDRRARGRHPRRALRRPGVGGVADRQRLPRPGAERPALDGGRVHRHRPRPQRRALRRRGRLGLVRRRRASSARSRRS